MNTIEGIVRKIARNELDAAEQDLLRLLDVMREQLDTRLDSLEERVEEMDRSARDTDRRVDVLEKRFGALEERVNGALDRAVWLLQEPEPTKPDPIEKFKMEAMLNTEPAKNAPRPTPPENITYREWQDIPKPGDLDLPEPVESPVMPLVEEVRIKAIDPIYRHMGGRHNTPYYWPGTNAYARDAVLAVADNIERDADTHDKQHVAIMLRGFAEYLRGKAGKP